MKQVILFAGTTEGRMLGRWLAEAGVETLLCVATEYGRMLVEELPCLSVRRGRMDTEEMRALFLTEGAPLVLDVTHPYAVAVSENIRAACAQVGSEYLRLIRPSLSGEARSESVAYVSSVEEAVEYLKGTEGKVLVTTGSKELHKFTALPDYRERIYARVLAVPEVVRHCTELGFTGAHLICMQGPFSVEMNTAMLKQTGASYLVTKESGKAGGFEEKLEAAFRTGAGVVLIGRPAEQAGVSIEEGMEVLRRRFSIREEQTALREEDAGEPRRITLVGIGMGVWENMTLEAREVFAQADCILGSGRMLDSFRETGKPLFDAYDPGAMTAYLKEHLAYRRAAVALSGDVGFYSGAKRLLAAFEREGWQTELLPGISSVVYLCSRLRTSWEDVKLLSAHGRRANIVAAVREHRKTFALLGGEDGVSALCRELKEYGLGHVRVHVGERLHYEDERITAGTAEELAEREFDKLSVAFIENPEAVSLAFSAIPDEDFIRGEAPMTKSEIRSLSVAKLRLRKDSVIYDIGAGTGSVSVEMALQASEGRVWAVERKEAALALVRENCRKFGTPNVEPVGGTAPEALLDLPVPTHAFIGGSSGNLKEILELLLQKNPRIRVVVNAVTLETVGEAVRCLKELPFTDTEVIQIQASRARKLGGYQLMTGQNPVYIFSGQGAGGPEEA